MAGFFHARFILTKNISKSLGGSTLFAGLLLRLNCADLLLLGEVNVMGAGVTFEYILYVNFNAILYNVHVAHIFSWRKPST